MLIAVIFLFIGLLLLVWSADRLVFGAAALAQNMGISPIVIGMTILAMGSSAPEMFVSATAALDGKVDTAVGNVIGSNIANIALILGVTALIRPLAIGKTIIKRELPLMLLITILAGVLIYDDHLGYFDGLVLVGFFTLFILLMLSISKREKTLNKESQDSEITIPKGISNLWATFWVILGLLLLPISANILVDSAVRIAQYFGMSDLVIGLTIIAIGTSLPELAASVAGALKGEDDMAVGNIIGSNIFNLLAVMGIPALLNPSYISPLAMSRDFSVMFGLSMLLLVIALQKKRRISRFSGLILLCSFVAYQTFIFYNLSA